MIEELSSQFNLLYSSYFHLLCFTYFQLSRSQHALLLSNSYEVFLRLTYSSAKEQFDPYTILSAEIYFTLNLTRTTTYVSAKNETKSVHVQQLNLHGKYIEPCVNESYQALINMPQFIFAPSFYHSNVEKFTSNAFLRQCNMKRLVTEAR